MEQDLLKLQILKAGVQNAIRLSRKFDFSRLENRGHRFYAQDCLKILHNIPALLDTIEEIIVDQTLDYLDIGRIAHEFRKIEERSAYIPADPDVLHIDVLVLRQYLEKILETIEAIEMVDFIFRTCDRLK